MPTATTGKRAIVAFCVTVPDVTRRNSGSYWKAIAARRKYEIAAGLSGETGSNSASPPPVARARVLSCPVG